MRRSVALLAVLRTTSHAWALSEAKFIAKGKRVVAIAEAHGLAAAEKIYADPKNGFVILDGPGLHVWAADAHGVIIFDLSGQTTPGTDLIQWTNDDGVHLMDTIAKAITSPKGNLISHLTGIPHPITNRMGASGFWCGRLLDSAIACARVSLDADRAF